MPQNPMRRDEGHRKRMMYRKKSGYGKENNVGPVKSKELKNGKEGGMINGGVMV